MKTQGSVSAVIAAIDDEVEMEVERLQAETSAEIARLQSSAAAHPPVIADREARLAVARAQARERLAREDYRDLRDDLELREAWMGKVVEAAHKRLAAETGPCRRQVIARLADEALAKIPALECVVQISRADESLLDKEWVEHRIAATGKRGITVVAGDVNGGCIAVSADGRVAYDNSIRARAERLETYWRSALAALFEEARR